MKTYLIAIAFSIAAAPFFASTCAADTGPQPRPEFTPQEVVRIQLEALRANNAEDDGIETCFRFASPNNQSNTGPVERFGVMIKNGAYSLMLRYQEADFEAIEIVENYARQRVTLTDPRESITYIFFLSRQTHPQCDGCWMTDSVGIAAVQSPV